MPMTNRPPGRVRYTAIGSLKEGLNDACRVLPGFDVWLA
jgi:hypothetical protein